MKDTKSKDFIKELFWNRYSIKCIEIELTDTRTPDFVFLKDDSKFAFGEVKDMRDDWNDGTWTKEVVTRGSFSFQSYGRNYKGLFASKVASKIKDGYEQLSRCDLLKVLVFVNYFSSAHVSDLQEALQGGLLTDDLKIFIRDPRSKIIEERIAQIKQNIDLYIWIDKATVGRDDTVYFRYFNNGGAKLVQDYFK